MNGPALVSLALSSFAVGCVASTDPLPGGGGGDDGGDPGPTAALTRAKVRNAVNIAVCDPGDDVALFWRVWRPEQLFEPHRASVEGDVNTSFQIVLDAPPPMSARYAIEDPETGTQTDPDAPLVADASIYRVVVGMLDTEPGGVEALDPDKVIGQVDQAILFWTPIDLDSTAGVRGFDPAAPLGPLAAGYHLFVGGVEVDADTELAMGSEIHGI